MWWRAVTLEAVSQDAVHGGSEATQECRPRGKYWWVRWLLVGVAVTVLAVEVVLVWDQLAKAWRSLLSANWWWVLAAAFAALASMHSFAQIQRTLLKSAGSTSTSGARRRFTPATR